MRRSPATLLLAAALLTALLAVRTHAVAGSDAAAAAVEEEEDVQVGVVPDGAEITPPKPTEAPTAVLELTELDFDEIVAGDTPVLVQL